MEEMTIEQGFEKIESILEKMESREISLEESFLLYQQGMQQLKICNEKIAQVEKQVMQLNESGGLEPLDEE